MVVASPNPVRSEKVLAVDLPVVDLTLPRAEVSALIVKACEDYGFFKVINHGIPDHVISRMEDESLAFFSKTASSKQLAGPAAPFGYGCKNIGFNGDMGEIEYLLFNTNEASIAQRSKTISDEPAKFSSAVLDYVEAARELACELLDLIAEGLWVPDTSSLSSLVREDESDCVFRLNHYPKVAVVAVADTSTSPIMNNKLKVGFGEHTDPQILTLLRSNDAGGLQISPQDGVWVPVPSDPTAFWVNVGDLLQVITNGRFTSVKHRALISSPKSRLSMGYFAGPPLTACISPLPEMVTPDRPRLFKPFTWAEYKKAAYSLRLRETRLDLFRINAASSDYEENISSMIH